MIFPVVFKLKKNGAWVPPDAGTFAVDCSLSAPRCSTGRGLEDDPLHTAILQPGRGNPLQFLSTKTDVFPKNRKGIFHCQV